MTEQDYTTIPVTPETREKVRLLKRGGISYDELIQKMVAEYKDSTDVNN